MNLLHYEFNDGPDDSINGMLRMLVKELRYNRSNVTIEEFTQAIPALKSIESRLQAIDRSVGQPTRHYIDEIMKELDEETETESRLDEDLDKAPEAITNAIFKNGIILEDISYHTGKTEHYYWMQFLGYEDQRPVDVPLLITREIFRAVCYKHNYIFIDLS